MENSQAIESRPPQTPIPADDLRGGVQNLLSKSDCANFVQNLINQAAGLTGNPATADYALDLFDRISSQGGFVFEAKTVGGKRVGGTVSGSINGGNATVYISPQYLIAGTLTPANRAATNYQYAETALHEVIHHAGSSSYYSDQQLAQAAFNMMTPQNQANLPLPGKNDLFGNSAYYDAELRRHCK